MITIDFHGKFKKEFFTEEEAIDFLKIESESNDNIFSSLEFFHIGEAELSKEGTQEDGEYYSADGLYEFIEGRLDSSTIYDLAESEDIDYFISTLISAWEKTNEGNGSKGWVVKKGVFKQEFLEEFKEIVETNEL